MVHTAVRSELCYSLVGSYRRSGKWSGDFARTELLCKVMNLGSHTGRRTLDGMDILSVMNTLSVEAVLWIHHTRFAVGTEAVDRNIQIQYRTSCVVALWRTLEDFWRPRKLDAYTFSSAPPFCFQFVLPGLCLKIIQLVLRKCCVSAKLEQPLMTDRCKRSDRCNEVTWDSLVLPSVELRTQ